ncbi:MAG: hypothetical protein CMB66_04040 [Euryarchaeota archaeon]|nr:hypothetical protein [Euryarchaeota archaeon]
MDAETLMNVTPEELAASLLARRVMLKESLPGVIRNLEAEEESISPKAKRLENSFEEANLKVADLKRIRDNDQREAGQLISEVKMVRSKLTESGGMVNLDPRWKKKKLIEKIEEIEHKIQTSALDHKSERKLLDQRRVLISENDQWLKDRKESNPEMLEYLQKSRKMSKLYKKADRNHTKMLDAVEKAQPIYAKKTRVLEELKEIRRQLDRARELLSQSDRAIDYWEKRINEGFGDLGHGFPDLLSASKKVKEGGRSSFAKSTRKRRERVRRTKREEE